MTSSTDRMDFVHSRDGTRIAYRRVGFGPPVVIVHGGLATSRSWAPVAERLASRFGVFLVERRGRGRSDDGTPPHSLAREIDDVRSVLRVAGQGAALIGHSYGGAVALEAALMAKPGEIGALAVYEPAATLGGLVDGAQLDHLDKLVHDGAHETALEQAIELLDRAGVVSATPMPAGARRPAALVELARTVPRELRAAATLGADATRYRSLAIPTLVLIGGRSPARQQRNCERLAAALPDVNIARLERHGHIAHTADPDALARVLTPFLTRVRSTARQATPCAGRRPRQR